MDANAPHAPLRSTLRKGPRFAPILAAYVAELPAMASAVRDRAVAGDLEGVAKLAHCMKGSAGGYGFPAIMDVAAAIERDARAGDAARVTPAVDALCALCARARADTDPESSA